MERKIKETILPTIQLKYFHRPDSADEHLKNPGVQCVHCKKKGIVVGAAVMPQPGKTPKLVCENCAVDAFMEKEGYANREAAASRRRRMFDTGYLLTEILIDKFLELQGLSFPEDLSERQWTELCRMGQLLYNEFPKKKKL